MKKVICYLKNYKKESFLAPLFKMLEAIFELCVPLVMASMIDRGIEQHQTSYLLKMCGILVLLGIVGLVCSIVAQYFAAKAAVGVATRLRHDLFAHLLGLSFTEIDHLGTSTMITRMTSDINQTQTGVNMTLRLLLRSPFVVAGAFLMALFIDLKTAMIFLVVILALAIVVALLMAISIPKMKQVQQGLDRVLEKTRENLTGVRVLRAFCKEQKEIQDFREKNHALTRKQKKAGHIQALLNPITYVLINLGILCLLWVGALQVQVGTLSQGEVVALYNYMSQILVELIKFATLIITINKSIASANRVQEAFLVTSSMEDGTEKLVEKQQQKATFAVEFDEVSLRYKGALEDSLMNLNFQIKPGETFGIIGGTGSGKSSLVHLIPRFYEATQGEVRVFGQNVKEYTLSALRSHIGFVLQKATLFQGTIEENLRWGKEDATQEELLQAIADAQAEDVVKEKGGLTGWIQQGGRNLSGGQKQRLTIARALVRRPPILILDDSASALDLATDARLRATLKRLSYHPTIIIVSQRTISLAHAEKILVLEEGEPVGMGNHEELLKNCQVYQEIYQVSQSNQARHTAPQTVERGACL